MKLLLIVGACLIIILLIGFKIKNWIKIGNLLLITGGVKSGKSTLSVRISTKLYKKQLFKYKIKRFFNAIKGKKTEKPLLYSNVPLKTKGYTPLKIEHVLRKERFNYGSVIYIQEASLLADSMNCKDQEINQQLLLLCKLIAHETKGGYMVLDTQSILDCHYAIKRSLATYLYVRHTFKFIPFILLAQVQEMRYDEVNSVNIIEGDMDSQKYKWVIMSKKVWKKFDRYCYSAITDDLQATGKQEKVKTLKQKNIISLRKELKK